MNLWNLIQSMYGEDFANNLRKLSQDPRFAQAVIINDPEAGSGDGEKGGNNLLLFLAGKAPATVVSAAARMLLGAVAGKLGYKSYFNASNLPTRPKEDGLLEALTAFASAKEISAGKMISVECDPTEIRMLVAIIGVTRDFLKVVSRFTQTLMNNLSVLEDRAYTIMKTGFDLIRPVYEVDEDLYDQLEDTDVYLYGPARQGADTAKSNRKKGQEMQAQAEKKGQLAAEQKARNLVSDEIQGLLETVRHFTGTPPEATPPEQPAPAPAAPVHPAGSRQHKR